MNKSQFINQLRHETSDLPFEEQQRQLDFYLEAIDDRVEDGMSEDQAIAQLGSFNDIITAIRADSATATSADPFTATNSSYNANGSSYSASSSSYNASSNSYSSSYSAKQEMPNQSERKSRDPFGIKPKKNEWADQFTSNGKASRPQGTTSKINREGRSSRDPFGIKPKKPNENNDEWQSQFKGSSSKKGITPDDVNKVLNDNKEVIARIASICVYIAMAICIVVVVSMVIAFVAVAVALVVAGIVTLSQGTAGFILLGLAIMFVGLVLVLIDPVKKLCHVLWGLGDETYVRLGGNQ